MINIPRMNRRTKLLLCEIVARSLAVELELEYDCPRPSSMNRARTIMAHTYAMLWAYPELDSRDMLFKVADDYMKQEVQTDEVLTDTD